MDIEAIKNKIQSNEGYISGWRDKRRAAVTIPLVLKDGEVNVLFQVRSSKLKSQPGDVCFPGGKIEVNETPLEGAKRETIEELGVLEENIEIVKELDVLVRHDGIIIHPFLSIIKSETLSLNSQEVDHVFYVPLEWLLNHKPLVVENKIKVHRGEGFSYDLIKGGENYKFREGIYKSIFFRYKEYVIWGMTAEILSEFLKKL